MKSSKKEVLLLLALLGILAAVVSYSLVYRHQIEKAETLEQENMEIQARIEDLSSTMENKDSYIEQTQSMNQEMDAILKRFPVDVREEDGVLLAINQELVAPMMISSVGITSCDPVALPDASTSTSSTIANGGSDADISVLMKRSVTMNYLVSYEGLKRGIKNISLQDNRMSISSLTVSYDDSTGLLSGMIIVDMYCIPGQADKEYKQPDFSSVLLGSDNIFGSIEPYDGEIPDIDETAVDEEEAEAGEEDEEVVEETADTPAAAE